jgi:hypothetical protein
MISFAFSLRNPFSHKFSHLFVRSFKISKNKYCEFEIYRSDVIFSFDFQYSINRDHAGLNVGFGLLTFDMNFQMYDTRHWDYEKKQWAI